MEEKSREYNEQKIGCIVSMGLIAFALVVMGLIKFCIWLWEINTSLLIIPTAVIGFGSLYVRDYFVAIRKKEEDAKALREEQEAMAKIIHDENDDWRDPHW